MAQSRWFDMAPERKHDDMPTGIGDEEVTGRISDEGDEEFDDTEDLDEDEDEENLEESDR